MQHQGIIYEYVEDLVVISWRTDRGIWNSNCLRTFFAIRDQLEGFKERYYDEFGIQPMLRACLHAGNVVRAEIGDVKTQTVYHGDVMNTSARILEKCHDLEKELLVSSGVFSKLEIPVMLEGKAVGNFLLKGKERELELYSLFEKEQAMK